MYISVFILQPTALFLLLFFFFCYASTGRWEIKSLDHKTGEEVSEIFDFVLLATGHHGEMNLPKFPGLDTFKGKVSAG